MNNAKRSSNKPRKLPPITQCRFCDGEVVYVDNKAIYGRSYGKWPMSYLCKGCCAYVGTHPNTNIPLGTIADSTTREARKRAHAVFDPLWRDNHFPRRSAAYEWLAGKLGIPADLCHIGLFEPDQCTRAVDHCMRFYDDFVKTKTSALLNPENR